MNQLAQSGYATALAKVETQRETEARILTRLNAGLEHAMAHSDRNIPATVEALHENDRFWAHIAGDLAHEKNALPEALKAALISLAGFVVAHSAKVRNRQAGIAPLIEINNAIIRALNANGVQE